VEVTYFVGSWIKSLKLSRKIRLVGILSLACGAPTGRCAARRNRPCRGRRDNHYKMAKHFLASRIGTCISDRGTSV
jgi:hypothetical protein